MSSNPTPTTPLTPAQRNAFNVPYVKAYPGEFFQEITGLKASSKTAIFFILVEPDGTKSLTTPSNVTAIELSGRADALAAKGYANAMLDAICWQRQDPADTFSQWNEDGITWYPPRYLNGELQPNLGQPGQYSLPNDFEADAGSLGAYPTSLPAGWIPIPKVGGAA